MRAYWGSIWMRHEGPTLRFRAPDGRFLCGDSGGVELRATCKLDEWEVLFGNNRTYSSLKYNISEMFENVEAYVRLRLAGEDAYLASTREGDVGLLPWRKRRRPRTSTLWSIGFAQPLLSELLARGRKDVGYPSGTANSSRRASSEPWSKAMHVWVLTSHRYVDLLQSLVTSMANAGEPVKVHVRAGPDLFDTSSAQGAAFGIESLAGASWGAPAVAGEIAAEEAAGAGLGRTGFAPPRPRRDTGQFFIWTYLKLLLLFEMLLQANLMRRPTPVVYLDTDIQVFPGWSRLLASCVLHAADICFGQRPGFNPEAWQFADVGFMVIRGGNGAVNAGKMFSTMLARLQSADVIFRMFPEWPLEALCDQVSFNAVFQWIRAKGGPRAARWGIYSPFFVVAGFYVPRAMLDTKLHHVPAAALQDKLSVLRKEAWYVRHLRDACGPVSEWDADTALHFGPLPAMCLWHMAGDPHFGPRPEPFRVYEGFGQDHFRSLTIKHFDVRKVYQPDAVITEEEVILQMRANEELQALNAFFAPIGPIPEYS